MAAFVATVTVLVDSYESGIAFFKDALGLTLVEDSDLGTGKRWVVLSGPAGARLLLAVPGDDAQRAALGQQTGGRVGFFLETDDFARDYARFTASGVQFLETPRHEPYGSVVVFADPFGNKWDLIEPKRP